MTQGVWRDFQLAARRLLATPLFTIFAVLSLAVGVGVTTTVYSIVSATFWKQPRVEDPSTVAFLTTPESGRFSTARVSRPDYDDLRATQKSFTSIAASRRLQVAATLSSRTELISCDAVDGGYFETLGVRAAMGRTIEPRDEQTSADVAVLSHSLWRRRFHSDLNIVGRVIRLSGRPFEIVGVAAPAFEGPDAHFGPFGTSLWVPLTAASGLATARSPRESTPERDRRQLQVVGRLPDANSAGAAAAEISSIGATLDASKPQHSEYAVRSIAPRQWSAKTLTEISKEDTFVNRFGLVIVALAALVLVVACTNLSNLTLARGILRHQEFAIRRALGASRWRLVREQAAESLLLATAGALASYVVLQVMRYWVTTEFAIARSWTIVIEPSIDLSALSVAATAVLLSVVVFGLEPALALTRSADVRSELAASAGSVGTPKSRRQRALLRWQVAISASFFIIATMFVKYTVEEVRHDPGVDLDRLAIAAVNFDSQGWDEAHVRRNVDRVLEAARDQSVIEAVAVSSGLPFGTAMNPGAALSRPGELPTAGRKPFTARAVVGTPGIFRTLGVPILDGRSFDDRDHAGSARVVILNETGARALFGTASVAGGQLSVRLNALGGTQPAHLATVVGVARDTDSSYLWPQRSATIYLPFSQHYSPFLTVTVRSSSGSVAALGALQNAVRTANPDIAIEYIGSGRAILTGPFVFLRVAGILALSLGGLTLLLAMVGLFGIQSHTVIHRTREIGVRMTFGASAGQIKRMVLKDGYAPVLQGLALGVFIGFSGRAIIRRYMEAEFSLIDPWMFVAVPIPLVLAAFCACYLPARRASRVDPQVALRHL